MITNDKAVELIAVIADSACASNSKVDRSKIKEVIDMLQKASLLSLNDYMCTDDVAKELDLSASRIRALSKQLGVGILKFGVTLYTKEDLSKLEQRNTLRGPIKGVPVDPRRRARML